MMKWLKMLAALSAATFAVAPAAQAANFVYGSPFGANHTVNKMGLAPYFKMLSDKTDGKLNWKLVVGGQLAGIPGTPDAVGSGVMDGGIAIAPYAPREMAATNTIFSFALPGDDTLAAAGAMNQTIVLGCPECQAEYKRMGAVGFAGYATSPYQFMCRQDVKSVDDLKGLKVRASGAGVSITKIAGATPVSMSPGEATTALERGVLDCVLGAPSWLKSYGYWDVVKSVVDSPMGMGGPPILTFFNRDAWNSMTPAMRKAQVDLAPDLIAGAVYDAQVAADKKILKEAKDKGLDFVPDNKGFDNLMVTLHKTLRDQVLANAKDAGVKNGPKILDYYQAAYKKWQKMLDEQGHDRATFRKLLWDQIYSKVDPEKL